MLNAQENKVKSIVELNGTKDSLFGYVSQYPDGSYLVETDAADIFYYSASEVKRVSAIPLKSKGYMGLVEAGVGEPMSISVVNGYRFSPSFFLGLGIGYGRHLPSMYHETSQPSSVSFCFSTSAMAWYFSLS